MSAKSFGLIGAVEHGNGAVWPYKKATAKKRLRLVPRRANVEDATFTKHHDIARISRCRRDEGDVTASSINHRTDPFCTRTSLPCATSTKIQPFLPASVRRKLLGSRSRSPVKKQLSELFGR